MNQQEPYVTTLLRNRIKQHGLKPNNQQFDGLFRDFIELWREAEAKADSSKESKLWLLDKLDLYLLIQLARSSSQ